MSDFACEGENVTMKESNLIILIDQYVCRQLRANKEMMILCVGILSFNGC
jgi:hypothetical protein